MPDYDGRTALHYMSLYPDLDTAEAMIEKDADLTIKEKYGHTAVVYSAIYSQYDMVQLFMKYPAGISDADYADVMNNAEHMRKTELI